MIYRVKANFIYELFYTDLQNEKNILHYSKAIYSKKDDYLFISFILSKKTALVHDLLDGFLDHGHILSDLMFSFRLVRER